MNIYIKQTEQAGDKKGQMYCTTTFEGPGVQIQNSYLCDQPRFTSSDAWNLQKQKKQFPPKA
jgi:hypothetical protein